VAFASKLDPWPLELAERLEPDSSGRRGAFGAAGSGAPEVGFEAAPAPVLVVAVDVAGGAINTGSVRGVIAADGLIVRDGVLALPTNGRTARAIDGAVGAIVLTPSEGVESSGRAAIVGTTGDIGSISPVRAGAACRATGSGAEGVVAAGSTLGAGCVVSAGLSAGWVASIGSAAVGTAIPSCGKASDGTNGRTPGGELPTGDGGFATSGTRAGASACSAVCWAEKTFSTRAVEAAELTWNTSPSSPGLRIRIEIAVLQPVQPSSSSGLAGGLASEPQSQRQFQTQAVAAVGIGVASGVSEQFHVQFQTHVVGRVG